MSANLPTSVPIDGAVITDATTPAAVATTVVDCNDIDDIVSASIQDRNINCMLTDELNLSKNKTNDKESAIDKNSFQETKDYSDDDNIYKYLVIDSGPIIRQTGLSSQLWKRGTSFYTVPAVIQEIRDVKSRQHLQMLPFELQQQNPSPEAMHIITNFARQTGDYQSLSNIDIQVLALLYDLEKEACHGHMDHIRTVPKRTLGVGKIESLYKQVPSNNDDKNNINANRNNNQSEEEQGENVVVSNEQTNVASPEQTEPNNSVRGLSTEVNVTAGSLSTVPATKANTTTKPKTWAALVSPENGSNSVVVIDDNNVERKNNTIARDAETIIAEKNEAIPFGSMNLQDSQPRQQQLDPVDGQFSDDDEDDSDKDDDESYSIDENEEEDDDVDIDESKNNADDERRQDSDNITFEEELKSEFPSLSAAAMIPYIDEDDQNVATGSEVPVNVTQLTVPQRKAWEEERKRNSLKPITKSGKLYNSFQKYGKLMKPKPVTVMERIDDSTILSMSTNNNGSDEYFEGNETMNTTSGYTNNNNDEYSSRIVGGSGFSGQDDNVLDDGEGWITTTKEISSMKASGILDPTCAPSNNANDGTTKNQGPPTHQRAACATTDFAMQNVILQMNLELLSIDGMKIRKLKNWVTRCGACYKVYTSSEYKIGGYGSKRLFCERCGSDMMQRIAASVDGKTGRLRLHLSNKHKVNLRGTKYSLPKPGSGNKYQGDLLLREDQLLMGAWNLKVKMRSGGKARNEAAESIFGNDIASNVGCHTRAITCDDIKVGFGRQNPNSAIGRERRGKKKKSTDKACGLRRY